MMFLWGWYEDPFCTGLFCFPLLEPGGETAYLNLNTISNSGSQLLALTVPEYLITSTDLALPDLPLQHVSALEKGLAAPILSWYRREEKALVCCLSLNQSQFSWAVLNSGYSNGDPWKIVCTWEVKPWLKCLNPEKKKLQLLSYLGPPIEYGLLAWRLLLFHAVMGQYMPEMGTPVALKSHTQRLQDLTWTCA